MIQAQPQPDTTPIKLIVKYNRLARLNITDFKIIDGLRIYKIQWKQLKDNQPKFKWQLLKNLQPFIDNVMSYQQRNKQKITNLENEWQQYFYDGQVTKPLQFFKLKKVISDDEDIADDQDSQFFIGKPRRKQTIKKQKNIRKNNKKKKARRPKTKRTDSNKVTKSNLKEQIAVSEPRKQIEGEKILTQKICEELSFEAEFQKQILDWKLQIPYIQLLCEHNQNCENNRENPLSIQAAKNDVQYLPSTLQQNQQASNEQQQNDLNEGNEQSQRESYKLFTSEQENEYSNQQQSYQEVQVEQSQYERPQNMRQFIKQQMIALNIQSPSELLESHQQLKIEENSVYANYSKQREDSYQLQQYKDKVIYKCNFKQDNQIQVKKQEATFCLDQLFCKLENMDNSERTTIKKDRYYKYIYQNILSAEEFRSHPLPLITHINKLISYGSITFYSINVRTPTSHIQKFILPEVMSQYYRKIEERFLYDC